MRPPPLFHSITIGFRSNESSSLWNENFVFFRTGRIENFIASPNRSTTIERIHYLRGGQSIELVEPCQLVGG